MLLVELGDALGEEGFLFAAEEGGADADALLGGTHRVEGIHCYAIGHELAREL